MIVKLSPQVSDRRLYYNFEGDKVITNNGTVLDFTDMPDGVMESSDYNFLLSAKRENGILYVELLNPISESENRHYILFPEWQEV